MVTVDTLKHMIYLVITDFEGKFMDYVRDNPDVIVEMIKMQESKPRSQGFPTFRELVAELPADVRGPVLSRLPIEDL